MSVKRPAYIEQSDIGTKPSQVYGWDEAPKRISSTTDGAKERLDVSAGTVGVEFIDTTGASNKFKSVDGKPRVSCTDYLYDIAEGNVSGHTAWSKIGYNGDVDAGTEDMISQGGQYAFRATETQMAIVSSNDNDGKTGGAACTGVRTVTLYYLDDEFTEKTEDITLNGSTPVNTTATDIYRVNNMRVKTCGTNGSAVGNITLSAGGVTYGYIALGQTRQRQCVYTVPKLKTLYVTSLAFSVGGATKEKAAVFTTLAKYDDKACAATTFFMPYTEVVIEDDAYAKQLEIPLKIGAGVDLKVQARGLVADCVCSCTLRGWIE
jgi:hypothetical protein